MASRNVRSTYTFVAEVLVIQFLSSAQWFSINVSLFKNMYCEIKCLPFFFRRVLKIINLAYITAKIYSQVFKLLY